MKGYILGLSSAVALLAALGASAHTGTPTNDSRGNQAAASNRTTDQGVTSAPPVSTAGLAGTCGWSSPATGACSSPDGIWSLSGSGTPCPGCPVTIVASNTSGGASSHLAAVIIGPGFPAPPHTFFTGCTYDVPVPVAGIFILGMIPSVPAVLPTSIPLGTPPGTVFTFQLFFKYPGIPPSSTYSTNPVYVVSC